MDELASKQKGLVGITTGIQYFTKLRYTVLMPLVDANKYDFVLEQNGQFSRVQVKTSSNVSIKHKYPCYNVILESRGGPGGKKRIVFKNSDYDLLFVVVEDGRMWSIPASEITSTTSLTVGTEKYAKFEIQSPFSSK